MMKEIPFQEGKVIFFKEANLWNDLLERCKSDTKTIDIATYNFNFMNKYERSFYKELSTLANLGIDVRLLYSIMTFSKEDKLEVEEIFKNFVLCAKLTTNHSKIFITDNFAYIGSANFSFNSNKNYECGVIFDNKEIVSKIRELFMGELFEQSELTNIPKCFDPFDFLPRILNVVEVLSKIEKKEDLCTDNNIENIAQLRYLDDLEKNLKDLGLPVPVHFDWWQLFMLLSEKKQVPDFMFHNFKEYLYALSLYLNNVTQYVNEQYESIGRIELLKRIKVIK
ncbi:phospholipase D-like domain-containing protein [Bacillus sp. BS98]|uniref:phospholipase D-like domain-containing protein n=1 Tax=Bacillus sp. BS98 TaxID=2608254 RepID=UPI00122EFF90|nr:phospholipase D-like domain-containing protein [Bacillus sp. BS98]QEQ20783.1 NgoFVII family restriction endonuclease [Bacillus sp. BS98]